MFNEQWPPLLLRCHGDAVISTLEQPRVFLLFSSVLSLVCCLCEWESHHLAIVRNIISSALPRSSSVSVSVNTTIQGLVWPSGRLHSDYMSEVSNTTASDPVHYVMLDVELILDVCISDVRNSWHTKDFPETTHFECSQLNLYSLCQRPGFRVVGLDQNSYHHGVVLYTSTFVSVLRSLLYQIVANLFIPSQASPILLWYRGLHVIRSEVPSKLITPLR